jgi:hypothetical protein
MTSAARDDNAIAQLQKHLTGQCPLEEREGSFDMDDTPEEKVLATFAGFNAALLWLKGSVIKAWRTADQAALRSQTLHRRVARTAIISGTAAIVLAIAQLSIKLTLPRLTDVALALEGIAILGAITAVALGVIAKYDRGWLGQRHLAERLRMLKFRALEQLWCRDQPSWQGWVTLELGNLEHAVDFEAIREWSEGGEVEPDPLTPVNCAQEGTSAFVAYYRSKRLDFQANYFKRRHETYKSQTSGWRRHLNLPLFLASVICVLAHFALELGGSQSVPAGEVVVNTWAEGLAVWFVALAAIIPVTGLGIRAYFAAFELPRSASIYAAKYQALVNASKHLGGEVGGFADVLRHVAQVEHFLEHEHREWLRLLLDTEWFL